MSNKKKVYGVYDLKDAEKLVCMDDKREVSEYTGLTIGSMLSAVCRGSTVRSRYIIETICEKGEL